jgi:predicted ATP-dependent serine protease
MFYTLNRTASGQIIATSTSDKSQLLIDVTDKRYDRVQKYENAGKLLSISESGTWSGRKDYEGFYKGQAQPQPGQAQKPLKVELTKLADLNIDSSLFVPMATNTIADKFLSNDGGFLPGTNVMAAGAPGVGKTTVLLELLSNLHATGKKVLFISAEMSQIDMARYLQRFPNWGQLPILFLADYTDECPQTVIDQVLNEGWDLVLTDSYTEVNDTVKEACNLTRSKTEKWFLDAMISHNKGNNKAKKYTTFVTILQLSKGGQFVGSNKLKHMTTSMMHLDWEGGENGRRFMEFSKNRVGAVGKKMYFSIGDGVQFDEARYTRDLLNDELVEAERQQLESEADAFDKLFGLGVEEVELAESVEL